MKSVPTRSLTHTIAGNTVWYSAELGISIVSALLTSIPLARTIGPTNLSYFTYLQWLTNIGGMLAMVGIPGTTRKYMAEYLGKGDRGIAWAIFRDSLRLQAWIVAGLLLPGVGAVYQFVAPGYKTIGLLMLCTVGTKLLACIPSAANIAAENLCANFWGAAANAMVSVTLVNLSLKLGWGLNGVSAGVTAGMTCELLVKMAQVLGWLERRRDASLPLDLRRRMLSFSGQGMILMILQIVVWDRSDLVFLKWLDKDPRQVTFFALAFNLTDKILLLPQAFANVVAASVLAEYGRNPQKLHQFVSVALKYALIVTLPVMVGVAAISNPLMRLMYGRLYVDAIPVLIAAALLAFMKPMLNPVQTLMQAQERQGFLIGWMILCAILNVGLDLTLIPWFGALGAMLANGIAQALGVGGILVKTIRSFSVRVQVTETIRILLSGATMGTVAWAASKIPAPGVLQLLVAVPLGAVTYLFALRAFRVLDANDGTRLLCVVDRFPRISRNLASACVSRLVRSNSIAL